MKYLIIALLLLGCSKDEPPFTVTYEPEPGGGYTGGNYPPDNQFTTIVRFYSTDSLMCKNYWLTVDNGSDIPIKYSSKLPHCRDSAFESVTLLQEVRYIFRIMDYDNNKVIDTFMFRMPRNGYACMSFNLNR
ncbi:hypothetical protein [Paraflavitalea pollutisoli]|uniref:hypothetical protein n=1 Tax=Paraflavitalea pollutisoli TaxID=3034143 RepID=UPI0023EC95CC|nr:hypothetical protein [Paraflavitalea sp. H1-2-19X]